MIDRTQIMIRLADEGVPVAVIARSFQVASDDILESLKDAIAYGFLVSLPAMDWPPGELRDERCPSIDHELNLLPLKFKIVFALTEAESKFLAALIKRGKATTTFLHAISSSADEPKTDPRIVHVHACSIRKKLARFGIDGLQTIWGWGFVLPSSAAKDILKLVEPNVSSLCNAYECNVA